MWLVMRCKVSAQGSGLSAVVLRLVVVVGKAAPFGIILGLGPP